MSDHDIHSIRHANFVRLHQLHTQAYMREDPSGAHLGADAALARKWQLDKSNFSVYRSKKRPIGPKIARQIESLEGLKAGWMDQPHEEKKSAEPADAGLADFLELARKAYLQSDTPTRAKLFLAMTTAP